MKEDVSNSWPSVKLGLYLPATRKNTPHVNPVRRRDLDLLHFPSYILYTHSHTPYFHNFLFFNGETSSLHPLLVCPVLFLLHKVFSCCRRNGKLQGLPAFTTSLISQLSASLKRIHGFGVRKIAVTTLQPLGCLPISTAFSSYENCSESWNAASRFHNQKLQQEIQRMNKESRENIYETLDLYTAFMSKLSPAGNMKPSSFLMPCCVGMASDYSCGNIDKNGAKKYVVCEKPDLSIFWDMVHPAQNGWDQVYSSLKSSLHRLY
ncbi:hypothetical protein OIU78_005831 [Salix suchowensis]|nr:hypothetical protein OIU78_005831 [Salix suchowensis]